MAARQYKAHCPPSQCSYWPSIASLMSFPAMVIVSSATRDPRASKEHRYGHILYVWPPRQSRRLTRWMSRPCASLSRWFDAGMFPGRKRCDGRFGPRPRKGCRGRAARRSVLVTSSSDRSVWTPVMLFSAPYKSKMQKGARGISKALTLTPLRGAFGNSWPRGREQWTRGIKAPPVKDAEFDWPNWSFGK